MLVIGIDLAAEPRKTALALIEWTSACAIIQELTIDVDDGTLLRNLATAEKAGIDCPFGWPVRFATFIAQHQAGTIIDPTSIQDQQGRRRLLWRLTDEAVRARTGLIPLSVAADRIAHVALRCARALAIHQDTGDSISRGSMAWGGLCAV